jgi:sortase (surface protein transpeptidase)
VSRRSPLPWIAVVAGTAAVGFAAVPLQDDPAVGAVPPAAATPAPVATTARIAATPPTRLRVPAIRVDAPVVPVGVDGRALAIPDDPSVVGWWRDGARPGAPTGTVVLAGHVDAWDTGPGALFHLSRMQPGDAVSVHTDTGDRGYVVEAVRRYAKPELPAEVFARDGRPRLVLISCGGTFDRRIRSYTDNVVVYATPA